MTKEQLKQLLKENLTFKQVDGREKVELLFDGEPITAIEMKEDYNEGGLYQYLSHAETEGRQLNLELGDVLYKKKSGNHAGTVIGFEKDSLNYTLVKLKHTVKTRNSEGVWNLEELYTKKRACIILDDEFKKGD